MDKLYYAIVPDEANEDKEAAALFECLKCAIEWGMDKFDDAFSIKTVIRKRIVRNETRSNRKTGKEHSLDGNAN